MAGGPHDYLAAHPSRPVLAVEVAIASLALDRKTASLCARAGVADYWIVNLVDHVLEVYRVPEANFDSPYGWHYRSTVTVTPGDRVRPLSAPNAEVLFADLLP